MELKAKKRDLKISAKNLIKDRKVPAIFYGNSLEPVALEVEKNNFEKVYSDAGYSHVFSLDIDGEKKDVVIKDIQFDPIKDFPTHIDFYAVSQDVEIEVETPIEFIGESPAEKTGFNVNHNLSEIKISAKPKNLPENIEVNLENLTEENHVIYIKDISFPEGVKTSLDENDVVVSLSKQQEEKEEETAGAEEKTGQETAGAEEKTEQEK